MALLAGAMCGVRNDSCSRKHRYARTSHGMASESLSSRVAQLVRAAEPVHPMFSVANNQFLN